MHCIYIVGWRFCQWNPFSILVFFFVFSPILLMEKVFYYSCSRHPPTTLPIQAMVVRPLSFSYYCKRPGGKCRDSGDLWIVPFDIQTTGMFLGFQIWVGCHFTLLASFLKHQILGGLKSSENRKYCPNIARIKYETSRKGLSLLNVVRCSNLIPIMGGQSTPSP